MREAENILARFPGPITLTPSRLKLLGAFALCVGVVGVFILLIAAERIHGIEENVKAYLGIALFAVFAVFAALRMLPSEAHLTLDAEGFEMRNLWRRIRIRWVDVRGILLRRDKAGKMPNAVQVLTAGEGAHGHDPPRVTGVLWDSYRLSTEDLIWLMEQWRERALATPTVPHIKESAWPA